MYGYGTRTPDKDKLFYGKNKISHDLIQIPDHHICNSITSTP